MAVMESCLERRIPDNKGGDTRRRIIVGLIWFLKETLVQYNMTAFIFIYLFDNISERTFVRGTIRGTVIYWLSVNPRFLPISINQPPPQAFLSYSGEHWTSEKRKSWQQLKAKSGERGMIGTSVEGEREVSLFASLSLIVNSNIPQKVIASDWWRADSILVTWMRMRQTGVAPPHEGRDSTAFRICVIVMLSYRKQTIQVYWLVVFWCCRRVQSPNGLRSRQKIEKTLHDPTPLPKQTNNGFQKTKKHPLDLPIQKLMVCI